MGRRYAVALKEAFPRIKLAGPDTASFDAISKFVERYVKDVDDYEQKTGVRLIDVLDIHCYPEASYDASQLDAALDVTIRMRLHRASLALLPFVLVSHNVTCAASCLS